MSIKNKKAIIIGAFSLIAVSVFAIVLYMNFYTLLTVDDYCYQTNFATKELLDGFPSLIQSMQYHYHYTNGRIIPHTIVQLFALYGNQTIFDIINSAVFVLLGFLIYKISNKNKPASPVRFMFIYLLMFLLIPAFGQTVLWFDGSINYLWGTTLIVLMLYFFHSKFLNPEKYSSAAFLIISIPLSFLAGGWSENASAVFLMLEVLYGFLYFWTYRKKLPAFYVADFIVSTVSWLIMITAPANSYRRSRFPQDNGKLSSLLSAMGNCTAMMRRYLYIFIFMLTALLMLAVFIRISKNRFTNKFELSLDKSRIFIAAFFFIASLTANFIMIAAPYAPRSSFSVVIYMMISVCMFASCFKIKKFSPIAFATGAVLFICIGAYTLGGMQSVREFGLAVKECENDIVAQVESGVTDVKGDAVKSTSSFVANTGLEILTSNPKHYINRDMATYYHADTILLDEITFLEASKTETAKARIFDWLFG